MFDLNLLAQQCAPNVNPQILKGIAKIESDFNPYAIGIVGAHLKKQPHTYEEAIKVASYLEEVNLNYSVGILQINK